MGTGRSRDPQADAESLIRRAAETRADALPELAGAIVARLRVTVPEFFADDDVAYDMAAAIDANVARVHALLASTPARTRAEALPLEASDLLQSTIQHGIPLISLLEAYRSAQGIAADWWQSQLDHTAGPRLLALATSTLHQLIVSYIDAAAAQIRASYQQEREAHESSAEGRRGHLIRQLLAGEALDPVAAARTLNHPLDGRHVAVVLWRVDADGPDDLLHSVLTDLTATMGPGVRTLTTAARHRVYAWLSAGRPLDTGLLERATIRRGVHVAASGEHRGLDGFVRAHADALQVAAIAREHRATDGAVAVYDNVELVSLLSRDPDARDRFVRRVLGSLIEDTPAAERTRETLRAYLATGSSTSRAAQRLGIHRNTVAYRLSGLSILDEDASSDARRLETELALRIVAQLGLPVPPHHRRAP
ncbi:MAG: PucR family transcriptional regulator [Solirubrobacteraceae bacterium]